MSNVKRRRTGQKMSSTRRWHLLYFVPCSTLTMEGIYLGMVRRRALACWRRDSTTLSSARRAFLIVL